MKKISFAFDVVIIGALYGNFLPGNSIFQSYFWSGLMIAMIIAAVALLISGNIFKKNKS